MAKKSGKKGLGLPLDVGIGLLVVLIVVATVGSAVALTSWIGKSDLRKEVGNELVASLSVQTAFQVHRYQQLQLISRIFSTDPLLTSYLAEAAQERNVSKVFDLVSEYQNILSFDLAMVLDAQGRLLARTDDPSAVDEDLSSRPLVAVALKEDIAFGVWQQGDKLYHAAAVPLARDFDLVGYVVAGFAIDEPLARQIQRSSGASIAYLSESPTGPVVVASTLDAAEQDELVSALRTQGEAIAKVRRGNTVDGVELSWMGTRYLAALGPLKDASDGTVGAAVALTSLGDRLAGYQTIRLVMLGIGAAVLALGLVVAFLLGRGFQRPMRRVAEAADTLRAGDLEAAMPAVGGEAGRIAGSLDALAGQLREKRAVEGFLAYVGRALPEPARGGGATMRPQVRKAALVAVEMRRYANPKIGYDAEESMGRFARDVRRISTAVTGRKGQVDSIFGHRVLATFDGEGCSQRALAAATELLRVLSERENVFDEPEPPTVALTVGNVVSGSVAGGDRAQIAVAGLPVQQLESLMREATPGELFLSKNIFAELVGAFRQQGIEIAPRRGVVSPQPLFVVGLEPAAKVTGVDLSSSVGAGFPGEKVSISDVSEGATIGGRFELLSELGAGRLGVVWKARDRERGDFVALKILKPEIVADGAQLDRLRTIIRQWRSINHPNLVAIFDFAEAGGLPFISSEFVRGVSLRFIVEKSRRVPVAAALPIARQILTGLGAAHREKLIHGGLKPEDVLVQPAGGVKMMDFGLTPPVQPTALAFPGSPEYLAPEQLEGRAGDPRSDLYACGALFYEMLTGQVPFSAPNPNELRLKLLEADAPPPSSIVPEVPQALDLLVSRLLAKTPEGRFASATEALEALEDVRG